MITAEEYKNEIKSAWCPGCSNFGILTAVRNALFSSRIKPHEIVLVSGIGQAAKLPHYLRCNFFNGLHGRALPAATAIKAVNPNLKVLVTTGDGDCYGEGGNHFIGAVRRNPDIKVVVHNNEIYALTKGQASPTTPYGTKTKLQFDGVKIPPFDPLLVALALGCGFVARGFAGELVHLADLISESFKFKGFALIDVIQPCIIFGQHKPEFYKDKVFKLTREHCISDYDSAMKLLRTSTEKIPIGIFYKKERECFGAKSDITCSEPEVIKRSVAELMSEFC